MRLVIFLILILSNSSLEAESWKREASGFSNVESFQFDDKKVIHYKNTTTWKDTLGNYGTSKCFGLIVSNDKDEIAEYKMYCNFLDQDEQSFTHQYYRETDYAGGVGKSVLIAGEGKWKVNVGMKCTYAINYFKDSLFLIENCY